MQIFVLHHRDDLSPRHFEQCPAWAAYTAPEDIDEIVGWGVDRRAVTDRLTEVGYSDEFVFPVRRTAPLPSFRFLYLGARITAADGTAFAGYALGADPAPYLVAVFHGGDAYGFNARLPDLGEMEVVRLRRDSGLELSPFMPLWYATQFHRDDGQRIEGAFNYDRDAEPHSWTPEIRK